MTGRVLIAGTLAVIVFGILGAGAPASGALRIDTGADLQADAGTVRHIEEVFNRAEDTIGAKDLDALMTVYSEHYRYQDLTKADMRKIWKRFLEQYDRISTLHSFSRIVVKAGKDPTAQITCTGALWATSNQNDQRVNLASWAGDVHHVIYEHGGWRIVGQGRNAPNRSEFGQGPPPLFWSHPGGPMYVSWTPTNCTAAYARIHCRWPSCSDSSLTARRRECA